MKNTHNPPIARDMDILKFWILFRKHAHTFFRCTTLMRSPLFKFGKCCKRPRGAFSQVAWGVPFSVLIL